MLRLGSILIALLALSAAPSAHADVFVPDDPPQVSVGVADCRASAGGVELAGRQTSKGWRVRLRSPGGAWEPVAGLDDCPTLAVGPDGTVALSAENPDSGEILVRPPGGTFRAPVAIAARAEVEVAAGGWVYAVGVEAANVTLHALTIAPDGTVSRTQLGRGVLVPDAFAIDGAGNATVVWTDEQALRAARVAPGQPWEPARSFALAAPADLFAPQVDLAVSPGGRTLLTWIDQGVVQTSFDGAAAAPAAAVRSAGSPRAAVDDAGNAVIAFGVAPGRVMVVERQAGGAWTAPREIQGSHAPAEENEDGAEDRRDPRQIDADVVLAPDGRAIVAWRAWSSRRFGDLAVSVGRLGGTWAAPVMLSSPVRVLSDWRAGLTAAGAPRIAWDSYDDDTRRRMLPRAAVLVADALAPPLDRTAPEVTATLPTRAPATRAGKLRVRMPARCSEACDARLEIAGFSDVLTLAPGRTATFRVIGSGLETRPGLRRFRVRLTVSDRAGNVVRRTSTLRVRVLRRPLRSFKVASNHDFATCTKGGNRRLAALVNTIIEGLADKSLGSAREIRRAWRRGFDAIEREYPDECLGDTDVREHIYEVLDSPLTLAGYPDFYLDE